MNTAGVGCDSQVIMTLSLNKGTQNMVMPGFLNFHLPSQNETE